MSGRITTPFGATSTAAEVIAGVDLSGHRAIVTGGSSGLGVETARALAGAGAAVTLAVRDLAAGERVAQDLIATTGNRQVLVAPLDLSDQGSVAAFVSAWSEPLHMLVDNAGIMATPLSRTPQGWEMQFATNHLGHFALATGLHDALAAAGGARIVAVSSVGHINGDVDFDDVNFDHRPYDPWLAYGQSKTANILFAVEAAKRWAADGITANALNPGRITGTNLGRHIGDIVNAPASFDPTSTDVSWKNIEQGAATSVLLAGSPLVEGVTGRYFEDCNEAGPHQPGVRRGVASYALDPEAAARLWQVSTDMIATTIR
ncbi:SDR family NAD(P)-dependent oxidoreductase [Dactylosporangium darangshiense]|uniref:SDR family NAD(P)-dependent oxidoreductase n=1 Tax=Dactylosporangium darangshiense TaxID=579108 RepID=A0ABP8DSX3_9ACTN